jgi:hypothetical protein
MPGTKKPRPVAPDVAELRRITDERRKVKAAGPLARELQRLGATVWFSRFYGFTLYASISVERIRQVAPLLRAIRKAGVVGRPTMQDQPELAQRVWRYRGAYDIHVIAELKAGAKCRFVQVGTETTTIPAREETVETRPVYKLMCDG